MSDRGTRRQIRLDQIERDMALQPRTELHHDWIEKYALEMAGGAVFPPVTLFCDGTKYWLADGFHRVFAAETAGFDTVAADVHDGTRRDALLFSVGANTQHGHQRTNKDKRRAVDILLDDPEWRVWSDILIAARCAVSDRFVAGRRWALSPNHSEISTNRRVARGGTTYNMNTRKIGEPLGVSNRKATRTREEAKAAIHALAVAPAPEKVIEVWKVSRTQGVPVETVEKALQWLTGLCDLCIASEPTVGNVTYLDAFGQDRGHRFLLLYGRSSR